MTLPTVLVLLVGVLVVLAIAGAALLLDARRRASSRRGPARASARRPTTTADAPQTAPIDTAGAREDPPTVAVAREPGTGRHDR